MSQAPSRAWLPLVLFLGIWLLLLAGGRANFFRDPGTFWHTVVGEKILTEGFFDTDPFTFTFAGEKWIPHQWLGEVGMALVHRVSGLDGLLAVATGVLAALFAWLAVRLIRTGLHPVAAVAVIGLALAAGSSHFHVRPHLVTIVGVALTAAAVTDVEAGRAGLRRLWWLVPVYWIWSNTHGGALGGLTTLGLVGAGWVLFRLLGRPSPVAGLRDLAGLAAVGLACGLTAFVTPYGADIPRTWLDIMHAPRLPEIIREHARTSLSDPTAWPVFGLAVVYLFALAGTRPRDWRASWFLPLFWLFQAYARVRHAPLFAVAACIAIADIWPATRWAALLAARRPDFYNPAGSPVRWGVLSTLSAALCVAVALLVQASRLEVPLVGAGWARLDPAYWPTELTPTLKEHEPRTSAGARLFNEYIDGGFVIYHAPGYRVFVDDRCELFGDDWLVRFVEAGSGEPADAIASWEREYGRFDFALTRTDSGFDAYYRRRPGEWERLVGTPTATFYRRRSGL
jgi:hypothetical protein